LLDITDLILDDHETFRRRFFALYTAPENAALLDIWQPLAELLEVHAVAEEEIFYPSLLQHGADAKAETKDAIKDHNKIRDAIRDAEACTAGAKAWWAAVGRARAENDEHMTEEEREGLPDFRRNSPDALRAELGARFVRFHADHRGARGIERDDKNPRRYIAEHT
jgi:hemerythrin HHE cation binding domain-containing protein